MKEKIRLAAAPIFLGLCFILFFSPVLFSDRVFISDGLFPAFQASPALWTSLLYSGFPLQAAIEWQHFYVIRFIFHALPPGTDFNLYVVSAYVLAASFTHGYVYSITRSQLSALGAGLVFSLSGFMMAHLGHTSMIHAAAWLPWLIWSTEKLRAGYSRFWFIALSLGITLCLLAGHPQIFVNGLLLTGFYALFRGLATPGGEWRYWMHCLAAVLTGIGLAAFQLLPSWELSQLSIRESLSFEQFVSYSLPLGELPTLLFPYWFGHPSEEYGFPAYFGTWGLTETTGFVGLLSFFLIPFGALQTTFRKKLFFFWSAMGVLAIMLALGDATPLAAVVHEIRVLNLFRIPARHFLEFSLAAAVLVGLGLHVLQSRPISNRFFFLILFSMLGLLASLLLLLRQNYDGLWQQAAARGTRLPEFWQNPALIYPLLLLALGLGALAIFRYSRHRSPLRYFTGLMLLAMMGLDTGSFGFLYHWRQTPPPLTPRQLQMPEAARKYINHLSENGQRMVPMQGAWQVFFAPNLSHYQGIPTTSGYGPLILKRYHEFLGLAPAGYLYPQHNLLAVQDRSLDLLGGRYLANLEQAALRPLALKISGDARITRQYMDWLKQLDHLPERWRFLEKIGPVQVYENLNALPRAWLVSEVISAEPAQILQAIRHSKLPDGREFNPRQTALVEQDFQLPRNQGRTPPTDGVTIIGLEEQRLELEVHAPTPCLLVLSDIFYPGWQATVNEQAGRIIKTNYLLRGVPIPAGRHKVVLQYYPKMFYLGLGISVSALIIMLAVLLIPVAFRQARHTASRDHASGLHG